MSFLQPWFLYALPLALLPWLLHWIGKKVAQPIPFAAMALLQQIWLAKRGWYRLQQWLLLFLRTMLLISLVVAIAHPLPTAIVQAVISGKTRQVVLLLDTSAAMNYLYQGKRLLDGGKEKAQKILSQLQAEDEVFFLSSSPQVHLFTPQATQDHRLVKQDLQQCREAAGHQGLLAAWQQVVPLLKPDKITLVYIISDLSKQAFQGESFPWPVPEALAEQVHFEVIDAADRLQRQALFNTAVVDLTLEASDHHPLERIFTAEIANFSDKDIADLPLHWQISNATTQQGLLNIKAHSSAKSTLTYRFTNAGFYTVDVHVTHPEDGFAADDSMMLSLQMDKQVRVLLIPHMGSLMTGQVSQEHAWFFVERALAAVPPEDMPLQISLLSQQDLDIQRLQHRLENTDVVMLLDGVLPFDGMQTLLNDFVEQGGGLFIALSDDLDFSSMNQQLGRLLPHPLRDRQQIADKALGRLAVGLDISASQHHSAFENLQNDFASILASSRTTQYYNLDLGSGLQSQVLWRFDNGAPALVESLHANKGRVLLWTTALKRSSSDLPLRPAFPAIMQQIARYLAHAEAKSLPGFLRQGQTLPWPLQLTAGRLSYESSSGLSRSWLLEKNYALPQVILASNDEVPQKVEIYKAFWQPQGSPKQAMQQWDMALAADLTNSDFSLLDVFKEHGPKEESQKKHQGTTLEQLLQPLEKPTTRLDGSQIYAAYLLAMGCLLAITETLLASRF